MKTAELVSKYRHIFNTDYTANANNVGAWLFAEGSGTSVDDASVNSNSGTFASSGHPAWSATVPGAFAAGSASFNNTTSDYIDLGAAAALDLTGPVTVVAWVRPHTTTTQHVVFNNGTYGSSGYYLTMYNSSDNGGNGLSYYVRGSSTNNGAYHNGGFTADTWYHVVGICNENTGKMQLYINGTEATYDVQNDSVNPTANTTTNAKIGSYSNNTLNFDGLITEVAVFSDVLTSTEINEILTYGLKPGGAPATTYRRRMTMGVGI